MRNLLFILTVLLACSTFVVAQDDTPVAEVFGGYSYLRTASGYDTDSHGWNASASFNVSKHVGIKADFGGYYNSETVGVFKSKTNTHTYLFGLQGNLRSTENVNPFVHALFGAAHDNASLTTGITKTAFSNTGFAMALGGGIDVKLSQNISWRLFQADYLLTRSRDPFLTPLKRRNVNNLRISTGLVIH